MMTKTTDLIGYKLLGTDGEIGKVKDFYFDDRHWVIRYLVAHTGAWLVGKQVLISPYAVAEVIEPAHDIKLNLTKKQIEASPSIDADKPVSRQFEESYYGYYGWPMYWSGSYIWGAYPTIVRERERWEAVARSNTNSDSHLRSTHEVIGYHIQAADGVIGHVKNFIVDEDTWAIRYLIVETKNWWPGKKVLISPRWLTKVDWTESMVFVNLTREEIRRSSEYSEDVPLSRDYEANLYRHYGRQGYWGDQAIGNEKPR